MNSRIWSWAGRYAVGTWLLLGSALARGETLVAPPAAAGLVGLWKGPLAIPGGSLPIQITIIQPGLNNLTATLDLPAKRIPVSLTFRGDTLVFYAPTADCRFVCVQTSDGKELRGQWSQPGLRVPLLLRLNPDQASPASTKNQAGAIGATTYRTVPVKLVSQPGNVQLTGAFSVPDGPGPFPGVVLLSDMSGPDYDVRPSNYRLLTDLAASLARQGIAVLRLDDRGVDESTGNGSTTTADRVHDAQAGLGYLRVQPTVDPARTGLIGHGEGGNVALLAAAQPVPPSFVVTLAASGLTGFELLASQAEPAAFAADTARAGAARRLAWATILGQAAKLRANGSNAAQVETYVAQQRLKIKNEARKQAEAAIKFRRAMLEIVRQTSNDAQAEAIVLNMMRQRYPTLDPALARRRATQLTKPWCRYYLNFDPQPALANVHCPVLLLNGTDDAEVSAATNLPALEKGLRTNKRVTARRLPGLNHWLQAPAAERAAANDGGAASPTALSSVLDWVQLEAGK